MTDSRQKKQITGVVVALCVALVSTSAASAHVTVKPGEVAPSTYQLFTVNVPNEKDIPTVSVKVVVPESIKTVTPSVKAGWEVATEKEGSGEDVLVRSVTWSGGQIGDGLRDEFTFSAKTPDEQTELKWKAYQTYSDGTVVAWDQEDSDGHSHSNEEENSGPLSITTISESAGESDATSQQLSEAKAIAERGMYLGIGGLILGGIAVIFATRKNS